MNPQNLFATKMEKDPKFIDRYFDMKLCMFANRRCCGEECVGWIHDDCFIFLLLPHDHRNRPQQSEFNWSHYGLSDANAVNSPVGRDDQLSFLDELEKQITQKNID